MSLDLLYIDDEPDIRELVEISLERDGRIAPRTAPGGEAGLAAFAEKPADAVLLDVMMPGLDGPATLEQLRRLPGGAQVPVIFFTAHTRSDERERLLALGAQTVLIKPFDPLTLADDILAALGAVS
jgi:CheY-like chemotaxis protein